MKKIIITTQKQLDKLKRVEKDEECYIRGVGLRLNSDLEVFGFIGVEVSVDTGYYDRRVILRDSSSAVLWGSSRAVLWGSSRAVLWDSSCAELRGSSRAVLWGSSRAVLWDSSRAELRDSSRAVLWDSSSAVLWGSSVSWVYSATVSIELFGFSVSYKLFEGKGNITKKKKTATIITVPKFKPTFSSYQDRYPVVVNYKTATLYKALHKKEDGTYFSDYDKSFIYELGKEYIGACSPKECGSCSQGLHIAHKSWARSFGSDWNDMALVECEVNIKDIVVSEDTDGKIRCSKLKVVRELPKEEWI